MSLLRFLGLGDRDGKRDERETDTGYRRSDARTPLADADDLVGGGDRPIEEDGLLKPRLVVVVGRGPVAAFEHLASGLGVERFVGVRDGGLAEAKNERQPAQQEEPDAPRHAAQSTKHDDRNRPARDAASVAKVPPAREHHGHAVFVSRGDHLRVPNRAAWLNDGGRA